MFIKPLYSHFEVLSIDSHVYESSICPQAVFEKKKIPLQSVKKISHTCSHTHSLHSKQEKNIPMNCALHLGSFPQAPNFGALSAAEWSLPSSWAHPSSFVALEELNARVQDQSFDADLNTDSNWLLNDGILMVYHNPSTTGWYNPLYTVPQTTRVLFHCSSTSALGLDSRLR